MASGSFATAVNCIDGRAQRPVADWVRERFAVEYVDTVTVPGPDKVLTEGAPERVEVLRGDAAVSVTAHASRVIAIAGHFGCAGNSVAPDEHIRQIRLAVQQVAGWGMPVRVVGLWVNQDWQVELVADTGARE